MRIIDIRETTVPIEADMSNAFINFSKMNVSVLAIVTDEKRDGEPVVGYGFNSNGRYAQGGLLRERLVPRVLEASPESLIGEHGDLDPSSSGGRPCGTRSPAATATGRSRWGSWTWRPGTSPPSWPGFR